MALNSLKCAGVPLENSLTHPAYTIGKTQQTYDVIMGVKLHKFSS